MTSDRFAKEDFAANGSNITSGTVAIARLPVDADLATLSLPASTTISTFGASLIDDANAAGAIATLGLDADIATLSLPASTTISAFGATLIDDANAAAALSTLGLDADIATFAVPASTTISTFGASLVDDANAAAAIATLGLDADLATLSLPASTTISAFGKTLIDDADAATALSTLGLGTIAVENTPLTVDKGGTGSTSLSIHGLLVGNGTSSIAILGPDTAGKAVFSNGVGSDPVLRAIAESDVTNLTTDLAAKQPLDSDLTTIAGLTATTDNMIQSVGSAWASRTPAQVKTALALNNLDNTSDANKPVSTAQQTALNLKANLASPTFTGVVTAAALTVSGQTLMGYSSALTSATLEVKDAMHIYGANELQFLGTGEDFASTIDLRRIKGTFAGGYVAVTSGTRLGGIHIGGSNSASALYDCAQIMCYADGAFDTTSNGGTGKSPSRWEFYTTAAASAGGSQTLALTIGSDKSLTMAGAATIASTLGVTGDVAVNTNKFTVTASSGNTLVAGTLDVTGATTLTGALTGNGGATIATLTLTRGVALAPSVFVQRINGSLAVPTAVLATQTLGTFAFSGQYDSTVAHTKTGAQIAAVATTTWLTTTAGGAKLVFSTMPDAAAIATSMVLDQDGTMTLTPNVLATAAALTISSPATNDDPIEQTFQDRVTTTNATPTNFGTQISVPASTAVQVEAFVTARRTGGSAGTTNDIACYRIFGAFNSGGQVGTTTKTAFESQAAFDCDFGAVASNVVPITVTGAANNNVTWHVTYRVRSVGT